MKAYRIKTDTMISPFQEHPRSLPILNKPLEWHQRSVVQQMGMELVDVDDVDEVDGGERMQFTLAFPGVVQANRFLNDTTMGRNSFVGME